MLYRTKSDWHMSIRLVLVAVATCLPIQSSSAEIGARQFHCAPVEVYELTFEGLRMASPETSKQRIIGREFIFNEATGEKNEISNGRVTEYTIVNSGNLMGSPIVAMYGNLNPTFLKFLQSDDNDPSKFIYFQFGGGINVFGKCNIAN